jgi:hypothetical protein
MGEGEMEENRGKEKGRGKLSGFKKKEYSGEQCWGNGTAWGRRIEIGAPERAVR